MKTLLLFFCLTLLTYISFASDKTACTDCSFTGTVVDASTKKPMTDVVITAKSNGIAGEQKVFTDELGQYKMPALPAGSYTLRFEKDNYKSVEKKNLSIKKTATKLNIELFEEGDGEEDYHNLLLRADFI
ncbi:MAG TPA: carboxypeptidase-like regulatory domain-containing protein [Panacibacter sp.]|nr:carboxypeptidase-like regulatory domain-containing protein [Panacibacter sp.]